jgi:hypothetical protein
MLRKLKGGSVPAPGWLRWTLVAAMMAVAVYHLSRLAAARWRRDRLGDPCIHVDVELTHAAMGSAMAVMVFGTVALAPLRGIGLVFGASTLWFASRAVYSYATGGPGSADVPARQVIGCAAMAYMLLVLAAPAQSAVAGHMTGAMSGMAMSGAGSSVWTTLASPVVRLVAVGATIGVAGWTIVRMRARAMDAGPTVSVGCQLAVSMTTVYMLVAM